MTLTLNEQTAATLQGGMQVSTTVELPIPAPVLYVLNGNPRLEQIGGPAYFGGWATDAEKFVDLASHWNQTEAPTGFKRENIVAESGKKLDSFASRSVLVAPIDMRASWYTEDNVGSITRSPDYFEGNGTHARRHVQTLVYLASKDSDVISPWGVAMLTAKGKQAGNLTDAFANWQKHTAKLRKTIAPNVPAWCFYLAIGTFGEFKQLMAGKEGGKQSPITPIAAYLPEALTAETLEKLFVGQDVADQMAYFKLEAADWLNAWGHPTPKGQTAPAPIIENAYFPDMTPPPTEDDLPF